MRQRQFSNRSGYTLIELLAVIALIALLIGLLVPAIQKVRARSQMTQCQSQLMQLGIGLHGYHDIHRRFPPAYIAESLVTGTGILVPPVGGGGAPKIMDRPRPTTQPKEGEPQPKANMWGWPAFVLPYVEQKALFDQIDFAANVNDPAMDAARLSPFALVMCPSDREAGIASIVNFDGGKEAMKAATSSYAACYGAMGLLADLPDQGNGVMYCNSRNGLRNIKDGSSQTLLVGERGAFFARAPWAGVIPQAGAVTTPNAPVYMAIMDPFPTLMMARIGSRPLHNPFSEPYDFFSPHDGICHFLFADGSVHALSIDVDPLVLQALATRDAEDTANGWTK